MKENAPALGPSSQSAKPKRRTRQELREEASSGVVDDLVRGLVAS